MEPNPQQILEQLIHRELTKLTDHDAPATLIPRVLAQIQARQHERWWQRAWPHWPLGAQLASLPILLAGAGTALFAAMVVWKLASGYSDLASVSDLLDTVWSAWDVVGVLGNAVMVLGRSLGQQLLLLLVLVPLSMYLACVGLGTLCYRMAACKR
jgi:hypothetical protein